MLAPNVGDIKNSDCLSAKTVLCFFILNTKCFHNPQEAKESKYLETVSYKFVVPFTN